MAHIGKKLRLREIRRLGRLLRLVQGLFGPLAHLDFLAQQVVRRDQARGAFAYLGVEVLVDLRQLAFRAPAPDDLGRELRTFCVQVDKHRHFRFQDVGVHRLGDVINRPHFVTPGYRLRVVGRRGEENNGGVTGTPELADQCGGFETVHFGHPDVQQNDRELGFQNLSQRLLSRPDRYHVPVGPGEELLHRD